jgi:hypothetical protein
MKDAQLTLSKEEANVLLAALEMHSSVHDAIVGGLGHKALLIIDKVIEAGFEAGWEQDEADMPPTIETSTTVNVVRQRSGAAFEAAQPPTPFEE